MFVIEKLFHASTPADVAQHLLTKVQDDCKGGKCPHVPVGTCSDQSVDDIQCPMPVADTSVKLGTDAICDTGCDDWPCKAACQGIDVGICYSADWVLCKAGCLGIPSCVHKCEKTIVDPCKTKLIHQCKDKCEAAFTKCKKQCEKTLTMDIGIEFDRMQRAVTSSSLSSLDINCSGNQLIADPLLFNASMEFALGDVSVDLKIHTLDAGIRSTNGLTLDKIALVARLPFNGKMNCVFRKEIDVHMGSVEITSLNLDVDLHLEKSLDTIVAVVCVGLPFCKDAIKKAISNTIKNEIEKQVPKQMAQQLTQVLQGLTSKLQCPKIHLPSQELII